MFKNTECFKVKATVFKRVILIYLIYLEIYRLNQNYVKKVAFDCKKDYLIFKTSCKKLTLLTYKHINCIKTFI